MMRNSGKILVCVLLCFRGLVLSGQELAVYRLSLSDAIEKGLRANLSVLLASERVAGTEGTRLRRMSAAVLPRVQEQNYASLQNRNLRAFGISLPGLPTVVGPFSNYDFRVSAAQNIFDLQSYRTWKASELSVEGARLDYQDARDLIVRAVAGLYLNAQSSAARVVAAQSRVNDAEALCRLAKSKHDNGTATGVDVLRAEVQLANDKQALLIAQNQYKQALLVLQRNLGLRPGSPLELSELLEYRPVEAVQYEALMSAAFRTRPDFLSLSSQRQQVVEQQKANQARSLPKFSINGNYGALGRSIGSAQGTGSIQAQIDITLFDRDRQGESRELEAKLKGIDDQIADLRLGIEQSLHEALLSLESSDAQVAVAKEGQELASRELKLAQDRFQSGVTNNVEVTTAQDELARAQENYIMAVSSHVDAKFALARAAGATEQNIQKYVK